MLAFSFHPLLSMSEDETGIPEEAKHFVAPDETEDDVFIPETAEEEATRDAAEMQHKKEIIRSWAESQGWEEGQDFRIIDDISQYEKDESTIMPHERKEFFIMVSEERYGAWRAFLSGPYAQQRRRELYGTYHPDPLIDNGWAGRLAVGDGRTFFDTVAVRSIEEGIADTHHQAFKEYYRERTGQEFPTAEQLNGLVKEISNAGLPLHRQALDVLKRQRASGTLPRDGQKLLNELTRVIMVMEEAQHDGLAELPEELSGNMQVGIRHYGDLTYNAEHIAKLKDYDRLQELTGIDIPETSRIMHVYTVTGLDPKRIDSLCAAFTEYIEQLRKDAK